MELYRALAVLCERPTSDLQSVADALEVGSLPAASEYTELFALQLRPYASIYLSDDGRLGGEAKDRIAGFWRVLDLEPPRECDHLAVLLAFYAELWHRETTADSSRLLERSRHLRATFLHEHLICWTPLFLRKLGSAGSPFYARWAALLAAALSRDMLATEPPGALSLHLRSTTPLPTSSELDRQSLISLLTTPARTGVILTRAELASAARSHGLAGRLGERAYMLEAMLSQAPEETISWLRGYLHSELQDYEDRTYPEAHLAEPTRRLTATLTLLDSALGILS